MKIMNGRKKEKEVDGLHEKGVQELERISGFTSEEAKEYDSKIYACYGWKETIKRYPLN